MKEQKEREDTYAVEWTQNGKEYRQETVANIARLEKILRELRKRGAYNVTAAIVYDGVTTAGGM